MSTYICPTCKQRCRDICNFVCHMEFSHQTMISTESKNLSIYKATNQLSLGDATMLDETRQVERKNCKQL